MIVIHERAVRNGNLGLHPLDRARVFGVDRQTGIQPEITGVLNFCSDDLLEAGEIGLSDEAFRDLGLPDGAAVGATFAVAPAASIWSAPGCAVNALGARISTRS